MRPYPVAMYKRSDFGSLSRRSCSDSSILDSRKSCNESLQSSISPRKSSSGLYLRGFFRASWSDVNSWKERELGGPPGVDKPGVSNGDAKFKDFESMVLIFSRLPLLELELSEVAVAGVDADTDADVGSGVGGLGDAATAEPRTLLAAASRTRWSMARPALAISCVFDAR